MGEGVMSRAFVCINSEAGLEAKVLQQLKRLKGVEEAFLVYGVYDIMIKVNAETGETAVYIDYHRINEEILPEGFSMTICVTVPSL